MDKLKDLSEPNFRKPKIAPANPEPLTPPEAPKPKTAKVVATMYWQNGREAIVKHCPGDKYVTLTLVKPLAGGYKTRRFIDGEFTTPFAALDYAHTADAWIGWW